MKKQSNVISWVRGQCLGQGSFGTVSTAISKLSGDVFAVKSVDRRASKLIQSLENEIRILRSLSSPYVVEFLGDDVSYECSTSYRNLHMEFIPGGTIADMASRRGADVDEELVKSYAWCLVSALRYIHSQGIVHCDVKGKNVLVGSNPGSAKLADFGSAMEFSGGVANSLPRGSPLWMAPEVIRGEYQGPESDVWSLGCTVIEMVTGKPAWEDRGFDTVSLISFSNELPKFPTQLSELGQDFLDKCLQRDPRKRWSCDQLLQHPFICSASPTMIAESSPRCVLDCINSDFDEEEVATENLENHSASERISKLATNTGANWESDGWVVARSHASEEEEEGTSRKYADLMRSEGETEGTNSVYSDSVQIREGLTEERTEWEFSEWGCGAGSCRRYESQKPDLAVRRGELLVGFYSDALCNLLRNLLIFVFLTFFNNIQSHFYLYFLALKFVKNGIKVL